MVANDVIHHEVRAESLERSGRPPVASSQSGDEAGAWIPGTSRLTLSGASLRGLDTPDTAPKCTFVLPESLAERAIRPWKAPEKGAELLEVIPRIENRV